MMMIRKERGMHVPLPLLKLLFKYAICMEVISIVLMIDGDSFSGGDSLQDFFECSGLFGHMLLFLQNNETKNRKKLDPTHFLINQKQQL